MLPSLILSLLTWGLTVSGQRSASKASKTINSEVKTTTKAPEVTHTIAVGASGHKFTPGETKANIGDTIEWRFYPVEHWVIRGDFNYPCVPYEYVGTDRRGFSSGSQAVQAITDDGPRFRVRVNDTEPIYFYCGAPGSCVRYHMMGIVNPAKNRSLEDWQKNADGVDYQLRPGEPWPSEAELPTGVPSATSGPEKPESGDDNGSSGLSGGAIAGIAIGAVVAGLAIAGIAICCLRRRGHDILPQRHPPSGNTHVRPLTSPLPADMSERAYAPNLSHTWPPQKSPYPNHQPAQGFYHFGNQVNGYPTGMHGQYTPPPPSASPQPTTGNETMSSTLSSSPRQDGAVSPYYDHHIHTYLVAQQQEHQPKPEEPRPVELPTSADPGNSPLPEYRGDTRFSWAGAETEYRPTKEPRQD